MDKGITLSPKHGVNPSVMQCFVCGNTFGVALMGKLPGDEEAPHQVCLNYDPCPSCEEWMKQGIILISVDEEKSKKEKDLKKPPYRTGGWVVVKEEFVRKAVGDKALLEHICKMRMAFLTDEVWELLGLPRMS